MDELGSTLRAWRDRVDPAALGLTPHAPRRAPGLRREELATLAGISIEYVARLEQGRLSTPRSPSGSTPRGNYSIGIRCSLRRSGSLRRCV
jgi:hypothetical protein